MTAINRHPLLLSFSVSSAKEERFIKINVKPITFYLLIWVGSHYFSTLHVELVTNSNKIKAHNYGFGAIDTAWFTPTPNR